TADVLLDAGAAALNIIPDRNWNVKSPDERHAKVEKLHEIVAIAEERGLPVLAGTEMNAHGQKFVDEFGVPEMAPLRETFMNGALILYAHTLLERAGGMGYLSDWAKRHFASPRDRNAYFVELGRVAQPGDAYRVDALEPGMAPEDVITALSRCGECTP
ncbi:MAG TPA: hypothetical protein PKW60_01660, partial [Candidatus Hydrogenedentes bacterium]|nr:hypothetical protein [Candidatus Hydrogenedentota bacterium]